MFGVPIFFIMVYKSLGDPNLVLLISIAAIPETCGLAMLLRGRMLAFGNGSLFDILPCSVHGDSLVFKPVASDIGPRGIYTNTLPKG